MYLDPFVQEFQCFDPISHHLHVIRVVGVLLPLFLI